MPYRRKTWREELADDKGLPKIGKVEGKMAKRLGTVTRVIPAPREVDGIIRKIRKGRTATINDLRATLARKHGVDICCPVTTGVFAWIAAHAAAEDEAAGKKRITPWWRVVKSDGKLNPKFPGGVAEQSRRLADEGVIVPNIQPGRNSTR
ncbi:MAG: MGMT family protein [Pedosphaera sp.]|nr:MGMT family protein [Pedosphaera sp.]